MARLSQFKRDTKVAETGEWISPGDEYDDLEILTRGFTDAYTDSRAAKLRKAAIGFGGDQSKIPAAISRAITVEAIITHVLLDVRKLTDDAGSPVSFDGFCERLRDPAYADLYVAVVNASAMAGRKRSDDAMEAAGNSAAPSA